MNGIAYFDMEIPGAWPCGTLIEKANSEPGDANPDGALGLVFGKVSHPDVMGGALCYFVVWQNGPAVPIACMGRKLKLAQL